MEPLTLFDDCVKLCPSFTVRKATATPSCLCEVGDIFVKCKVKDFSKSLPEIFETTTTAAQPYYYIVEWDMGVKLKL